MNWSATLSALFLVACGQGSQEGTLDFCDRPTVQSGHMGRSFLLNYCTVCHSSQVSGAQRKGAPEGVDLDSIAGLRTHADRVFERTVDETMPPGGGVETEAFLQWLECGAPGEEHALPVSRPAASGEAFELAVFVEESAGSLVLTRQIEIGSRGPFPESPWSVSTMDVTSNQAWFWSETLYAEDGDRIWGVEFLQGLRIVDGGRESWTQTVDVDVWEDGLERQEEWVVHLSVGEGLPLDGRELTGSPTVISAQVEGGPEWAWHLAGNLAPVAQSVWLDDERSWKGIRINANDPREVHRAYPIEAGQLWIERVIVPGVWSQ